jgi:hypothetical protein
VMARQGLVVSALVLTVVAASPAQAQDYRWTDARGNPDYTEGLDSIPGRDRSTGVPLELRRTPIRRWHPRRWPPRRNRPRRHRQHDDSLPSGPTPSSTGASTAAGAPGSCWSGRRMSRGSIPAFWPRPVWGFPRPTGLVASRSTPCRGRSPGRPDAGRRAGCATGRGRFVANDPAGGVLTLTPK